MARNKPNATIETAIEALETAALNGAAAIKRAEHADDYEDDPNYPLQIPRIIYGPHGTAVRVDTQRECRALLEQGYTLQPPATADYNLGQVKRA